MTDIGMQEIKTKRLILRKFRIDDVQSMYENWASDKRVSEFLSWDFHKNIDDTKKIICDWLENYKNKNYYNWCIELNNIPIGNICVVEVNDDIKGAELGYCLGYKWWGQGIMPEAICAVCDFLLKNTNFKMIYAGHEIGNSKSGKALLKSNFILDDSLQNLPRFKKMRSKIITYSYKLNFQSIN